MRIVAFLIVAGAACAQSSNPQQLFHDAVDAQKRGDDALAVRKYQEILKSYPDSLEVRTNLGAALAKLNRYDEAIEQWVNERWPKVKKTPGPGVRGSSSKTRADSA